MSTKQFFVIENDPAAQPEQKPRSGRALVSLGTKTRKFQDEEAPHPAIKVSTVEMTEQQANSERGRPGVCVVGRAMPMALIKRGDGIEVKSPGAIAWGIDATRATQSVRTGAGVTVAILDTGIVREHPAFERFGKNMECRDFTIDSENDHAVDTDGHGTHCAGTIFGGPVDGTRIGVAPGVSRALVAKVLSEKGGNSAMLFDALNWANRKDANIVSMSLGFDFPKMIEIMENEMPKEVAASNALVVFGQNLRAFDALMASFRASAFVGRDMLVVAAAGNESQRDRDPNHLISASLPAAATGVISVAAYGQRGRNYAVSSFSNIDALIAAPGEDIVSAGYQGGFATMSGTSQACPHVAGLAALWWEEIAKSGETPTPDKVRERLLTNFTLSGLPRDCDERHRGRGRALAPPARKRQA